MSRENIYIDENELNHQYGYRFMQRFFGIIASGIAVVILSPLLLAIAICIKIDDPSGPVFYTQDRVGKDGKIFRMIKFRSMVSNADELLEKLKDKNDVNGAMF